MNKIDSIQYYEGDISDAYINHPFLGDRKAYVTLNSLFFDGIEIEKMRVKEGKILNPEIVNKKYYAYLKQIIGDLIVVSKEAKHPAYKTTRVERLVDYLPLKNKKETISFTSTSKGPFLESYMNKQDLVLMTFYIDAYASVIDFEEILKENYLKKEEQEVLLPPGLPLQFKERELTKDELQFKDLYGHPPKIAVDVKVSSCTKYNIVMDNININDMNEIHFIHVEDALDILYEGMSRLSIGLEPENIEEYTKAKKEVINSILEKEV